MQTIALPETYLVIYKELTSEDVKRNYGSGVSLQLEDVCPVRIRGGIYYSQRLNSVRRRSVSSPASGRAIGSLISHRLGCYEVA